MHFLNTPIKLSLIFHLLLMNTNSIGLSFIFLSQIVISFGAAVLSNTIGTRATDYSHVISS